MTMQLDAETAECLRRFEALVVGPTGGPGSTHDPRARVAELFAAAGAIVHAAPTSRWWPLAALLVEHGADAATPPGTVSADRADQLFAAALTGATEAIYHCRRVEHASGRCLFSPAGAAGDVCGRVLAGLHRACERTAPAAH